MRVLFHKTNRDNIVIQRKEMTPKCVYYFTKRILLILSYKSSGKCDSVVVRCIHQYMDY